MHLDYPKKKGGLTYTQAPNKEFISRFICKILSANQSASC